MKYLFTIVFSHFSNLYFVKIVASKSLISSKANHIATQFLGPAPNGMNVSFGRVFLLISLNLSGINLYGSG